MHNTCSIRSQLPSNTPHHTTDLPIDIHVAQTVCLLLDAVSNIFTSPFTSTPRAFEALFIVSVTDKLCYLVTYLLLEYISSCAQYTYRHGTLRRQNQFGLSKIVAVTVVNAEVIQVITIGKVRAAFNKY